MSGYTETWCPQCGPGVACDEDGCCAGCGSTATGEGADAAVRALDAERECGYLRRELDAMRASRLGPRAEERRALVIAEAVRDYPYPAAAPWEAIEARVDAAIAAYDARAKETP